MTTPGRTRAAVIGVFVLLAFFTAWIIVDYGVIRLFVGLVAWFAP